MNGTHLEEFFEQAAEIFHQGAVRSEPTVFDFKLAGSDVRINWAGSDLKQKALPAISHLSQSPSSSDSILQILAWDTASTGMMLPPPPWDSMSYSERAQLRRYTDERYTIVYDRMTTVFEGVDRRTNLAVYWTRDANWIPNYAAAAPMRHLFQGWLSQKGIFLSHSAAIGSSEGGILLAGKGGVGKSTTALWCMVQGFSYLGDDFVLLAAEPEPTVYSLYCSAKLNPDSMEWLPDLKSLVSNASKLGPEKALLFLEPAFTEHLEGELPLRAIVMPQVSDDGTNTLIPASGLEAFKYLAPDTVFRGQGDAQHVLRAYSKICMSLPCYWLKLGVDRTAVPDMLRSLI